MGPRLPVSSEDAGRTGRATADRAAALFGLWATMMLGACRSEAAPPSKPDAELRGLYAVNLPGPTRLSIDVGEGGATRVLHLTTLHLPPAELESIRGVLVRDAKGRWCLTPAPKVIAPCLVETSTGAITVATPDGKTLKLDRVVRRGG